MNNTSIDNYINKYLERENTTCQEDQKNLFKKEDYLKLLKSVLETIKDNKDKSLEELREDLYKKSGLEESLINFIKERAMAPGLVVSYGTNKYQETLVIGNSQEVDFNNNGERINKQRKMTEDTIFDLASVTKLFTSISILKLVELGLINLDDKVKDIIPQFKNLEDTTIYQLLAFQVPLKTKSRIDRAASYNEAEEILFDIELDHDNKNLRPYTDMGAMVLKYIIEKVTDMPYYDFLNETILKPNGLENSFSKVPDNKIELVANTNGDGFYYKDGNYRISTLPQKGTVYDPKARIMSEKEGNLSGHAGLFSTKKDMTNLSKALINHEILNEKLLKELSKNRTGRQYSEDNITKYVQYLAYLCYSKNPNLKDSEVYHALSGESFASAGWTGTQISIDPLNEIYFFLGGNRSHNRMSYIDPIWKDKVKDDNGKKIITLPNKIEMIDATRFAWERDEAIVHKAIRLTIQYKMLEDIVLKDEKIKEEERIKHL